MVRRGGDVCESRQAAYSGHGLDEYILPLSIELRRKKANTRSIATMLGQRTHETRRNHVIGKREDGDRSCCFLCSFGCRIPADNDYIDWGLEQFRGKLRN